MSQDIKLDAPADQDAKDVTLFEHEEGTASLGGPPKLDADNLFAEHLAYGPDGIRGIVGSPYVFGAAFLASLGGFSFGYDQGVISIINVMDQFHAEFPRAESAFGSSLMTAMLVLGAFVGCIFFLTWQTRSLASGH